MEIVGNGLSVFGTKPNQNDAMIALAIRHTRINGKKIERRLRIDRPSLNPTKAVVNDKRV